MHFLLQKGLSNGYSSPVSPPIFFFQSLINLKRNRAYLYHIRHTVSFPQIFFNKLLFCKPHILRIPGKIFFRDIPPIHLTAVSAPAAVISGKQLVMQSVELLIQFFSSFLSSFWPHYILPDPRYLSTVLKVCQSTLHTGNIWRLYVLADTRQENTKKINALLENILDLLHQASVFPIQLPQRIAFLYGVWHLVRLFQGFISRAPLYQVHTHQDLVYHREPLPNLPTAGQSAYAYGRHDNYHRSKISAISELNSKTLRKLKGRNWIFTWFFSIIEYNIFIRISENQKLY